MRFLRFIFIKIYTVWVLMVFTFFMILYLPGIILPFLFGDRYGNVGFRFLWLWAWTFSKLNFIPYRIHGREFLRPNAPCIYVSNHTSYLDIPGVCLTVPSQIRILAKKELLSLPILGWIIRQATVIVDRSSNESRRKSMEHLKEVLLKGIPILLYPEGTQNRTNLPLQPFYDGAFRIAVETQQPIIPMVMVGAGKLMPPRKFFVQPGRIDVVIDKEIPTLGLTASDVSALKEQVMQTMLGMIARHSNS